LEKEGKVLKDQDKKNSSQEDEVTKIGWSDFPKTVRIRLEFEI
jgi:hypothetical protein